MTETSGNSGQIMAGAKASRMSRLEAPDASLQINHALIVEVSKRWSNGITDPSTRSYPRR